MTTNKTREIKAVCRNLNKILSLKILTEHQSTLVFNKLVKLIKDCKAGNFDLIPYVETVIVGTLTSEEKKCYKKLMLEFKAMDSLASKQSRNRILGLYYETIIEYYPELGIENVCYTVNEILPDSIMIDQAISEEAFQKEVKKEAENKGPTPKKYQFATINDVNELEKHLKKNIIGQNEAIEVVCNSIKLKAAGFADHMSLFFLGKTGRGKTQLAKKLGEKFSDNLWVINCAEFSNGHEIARLIGSPPGYVGHGKDSMIKEKADKSKKWIIILDEIEKAHLKFFNFFLSLMDTGTSSDNMGNEIDLSESIFIFTSNCGMTDLKTNTIRFSAEVTQNKEADRETIMKAVELAFSPEFRGRIDEFVYFNDLTKEDTEKIAKLELKGYPIRATPELVKFAVEKGFSKEYGARNLKRAIRQHIGLPLADELLRCRLPDDGSSYQAMVRAGKVEIINTSADSK